MQKHRTRKEDKMTEAMSQVYKQLVPSVVCALGVQPIQRRVSESIDSLFGVKPQTQTIDSLSGVESQTMKTETHRSGTKRKQHNREQAYPTEAREREKAKKKEGYVAKKKQKQ